MLVTRSDIRASDVVAKIGATGFLLVLTIPLLLVSQLAPAADDAGFADVDTITVMPILLSETLEIESPEELHDDVAKMLLRKLAFKGYVLDKPRNWQQPESWNAEWIRSQSAEQLSSLMPSNASHAALLFVESLEGSSIVIASKANAKISAILLDTRAKEILWENGSAGDYRESIGLFTGLAHLLVTRDKYAALEKAFEKLFEPFPEKPFN